MPVKKANEIILGKNINKTSAIKFQKDILKLFENNPQKIQINL